jgi:hypothetical protein
MKTRQNVGADLLHARYRLSNQEIQSDIEIVLGAVAKIKHRKQRMKQAKEMKKAKQSRRRIEDTS